MLKVSAYFEKCWDNFFVFDRMQYGNCV